MLRKVLAVALYGAILLGANGARADVALAEAARAGSLSKLQFAAPTVPAARQFLSFDGSPMELSAYAGRYLLLNFWATWCAPCKKEMPGLDRLNAALGGADFAVITIATGRNNPMAMQRFFEVAELKTLPLYRDPGFELADAMGVRGLPYSLLLNPKGKIIARLVGDAEWDSESAFAVIRALIDQSAG